jgi:hypothetical protein
MRAAPSRLLRSRFPALPGIDSPRVSLRPVAHDTSPNRAGVESAEEARHWAIPLFCRKKVDPTQRTLTKVNHKVTQRTKLIHDLPQNRCVLRSRVKSSCSEPGDMCVCSVLSTDTYFQVHQARRRCTRLLTEALVNQLILRLIKCPDYPQPPKRGTPATVHYTRMTLIRPPCSSHRVIAGYSDTHAFESYYRSYIYMYI